MSMQILLNPIKLTSFGFFELNYDLLDSVYCKFILNFYYNTILMRFAFYFQFIGTITTYMVIMISFMPVYYIFTTYD